MTTTAQSTGLLAPGTYTIWTGKGTLNGAIADAGATITIYDNTSGSGNVLLKITNASTSSIDHMYNVAVRCDNGITAVVSGASAMVLWSGC